MSNEITDCLRSLTDEKLAEVERLSDEDIMNALENGLKERDLAEIYIGAYCLHGNIFYR